MILGHLLEMRRTEETGGKMERNKPECGDETSLWVTLTSASVICSCWRETFFSSRRGVSESELWLPSLPTRVLYLHQWWAHTHTQMAGTQQAPSTRHLCVGIVTLPCLPHTKPKKAHEKHVQYTSGLWQQGSLWIVLDTLGKKKKVRIHGIFGRW